MQPTSGGFLEAMPLTSFVVMSLVAAGHGGHPVVADGLRFVVGSVRTDGSWPIDTNLATWVTTLALNAVGDAASWPARQTASVRAWLLDQQVQREHPYTHGAPGGWAWTDRPGGVPDADDTAGALLAVFRLGADDPRTAGAAFRGIDWLLELQNRDGGVPTFCRGWGALPFDRSAPDLTAHALEAWSAWHSRLDGQRRRRVDVAMAAALRYLEASQCADGAWIPLWFGNEQAAHERNKTYGTARVVSALAGLPEPWAGRTSSMVLRGRAWLLESQRSDGGWGGDIGAPPSIEETGAALQALARSAAPQTDGDVPRRAALWLSAATDEGRRAPAAPLGLYFARLWYFEELYPLVFALGGLIAWRRTSGGSDD
jgi:squalene-hopene/tetraprenyl-beta-curcumene cyclase